MRRDAAWPELWWALATFGVMLVLSLLLSRGGGPDVPVAVELAWALGAAALVPLVATRREGPVLTPARPVLAVALIAGVVWADGPLSSPFAALYLLVLTAVALYRDRRTFAITAVVTAVAAASPVVQDASARVVGIHLAMVGAALATTTLVNHLAVRLREANELYRTVFERHVGPVYLLDDAGRFVTVNPATVRLLGYPREDLVGRSWTEVVAAEEAARLTAVVRDVLAGEARRFTVSTAGPGGRFELRGTAFPVRRGRRGAGVLGITEDVSDLTAARFDAAALRAALDHLGQPVAIFDAGDHTALYVNPAAGALRGGAPARSAELRWEELPPELRAGPPSAGGPARAVALRPADGAGTAFDVVVQRTHVGGRDLLVFTAQDATARVEREETLARRAAMESQAVERLRHLDRMKNTFLTAVSHELRTPVTVVRGFAETLPRLRDHLHAPQRARIEDALLEHATRLSQLLEDLLEVDRLSRGGADLRRDGFDVVEVARGLLAHHPVGERSRLVAPAQLPVVAERFHLERVLTNLLDNVEKYAPEGPVTVTLEPLGEGGVRVGVRDRGPGIPPTELDQVFAPFHRLDLEHPSPGTGLGLALVTELAGLHGGRAWAMDTGGDGAHLVVDLPGPSEAGSELSGG